MKYIREKVKILEVSLEEYEYNWWYDSSVDRGGYEKTGIKRETPYYMIKVDVSFGRKNSGAVVSWNIPIKDKRVKKINGRHEEFVGKFVIIESTSYAESKDDVYSWALVDVLGQPSPPNKVCS